ncbi:uncharacterized protein LOC115698718 [Cannabis sativa]|uniref:Uncharacterized protein n=1 Tax=Cannabis sativa TaxID=3483 RepID=A0A7J6HMB1_CANSA|nr:uncharacterized protein LOC115698718 [Cannabis sativa]KAF4396353.1 hypothetical protein G4B88_019153 [Cannabis sativa]
MGSSSVFALSLPSFHFAPSPQNPLNTFHTNTSKTRKTPLTLVSSTDDSSSPSLFHKSLPLAASALILLSSNPAKAGFLSGSSGIESVPGPKLPQIEFLERFNEENQKKYAENDARFKSSPLLNKLLEKSKLNKEKNKLEIQDKYCLRGAEWGVGDCSAEGMTAEEKDSFISMLKQKTGVKQ